jgi:dTDP-4-dehydrorhamnose 3,5-epimerase
MIKVKRTEIPEVFVLTMTPHKDERGFFYEAYNKAALSDIGIKENFVQDNHSASKKGVLRGLHYQVRQVQGKMVRVISGEIFDVAVDLRRKSSSFGRWVGVTLSADKFSQIWIPAGFAHGFYTISDWAEILYKTTDYYAPQWERTLRWDDPQVAIQWPIVGGERPLLSQKDLLGKWLEDAEVYE